MTKHLAIFKDRAGELILNGKKTVESRFSKKKMVPFGVISSGDLVYIKPSGKEIIGQFKVKKVIFYDGLTKDDVVSIRKEHGKTLAVDGSYWQRIKGSKYATLIIIGESSRFITSPVKLPKKDLRGWVVLDHS